MIVLAPEERRLLARRFYYFLSGLFRENVLVHRSLFAQRLT